MPLLDGFEALNWLRHQPVYQLIPIIILSTSSSKTNAQRVQALGANRFFTKPPTLPELSKLVAYLEQAWLASKKTAP